MKMNMKKFPYIFSFFAVFLLLGCLPDSSSTQSGAVKVVIADRTFKVPKGYFDESPPTGKDTESVVLEYSLPGFEILPPHRARAARQRLINEGNMRSMLLEAARNRPSLDAMVKNTLTIRYRNYSDKPTTTIYGLEKYPSRKLEPDPTTQADNIFVERDKDGHVSSFILCDPPGSVKIPSCSHKFIDKGLLYQIHWKIADLPQWENQRNAAIYFIDSLEYNSKSKE
jgi:hypothetical protein